LKGRGLRHKGAGEYARPKVEGLKAMIPNARPKPALPGWVPSQKCALASRWS